MTGVVQVVITAAKKGWLACKTSVGNKDKIKVQMRTSRWGAPMGMSSLKCLKLSSLTLSIAAAGLVVGCVSSPEPSKIQERLITEYVPPEELKAAPPADRDDSAPPVGQPRAELPGVYAPWQPSAHPGVRLTSTQITAREGERLGSDQPPAKLPPSPTPRDGDQFPQPDAAHPNRYAPSQPGTHTNLRIVNAQIEERVTAQEAPKEQQPRAGLPASPSRPEPVQPGASVPGVYSPRQPSFDPNIIVVNPQVAAKIMFGTEMREPPRAQLPPRPIPRDDDTIPQPGAQIPHMYAPYQPGVDPNLQIHNPQVAERVTEEYPTNNGTGVEAPEPHPIARLGNPVQPGASIPGRRAPRQPLASALDSSLARLVTTFTPPESLQAGLPADPGAKEPPRFSLPGRYRPIQPGALPDAGATVGSQPGARPADMRASRILVHGRIVQGFAADGGVLYWTEESSRGQTAHPTVWGFDLKNRAPFSVAGAWTDSNPTDVVADAERLYWVDHVRGWIMAASKFGGNAVKLATTQAGPYSLAIGHKEVYWANLDDGTIMAAPKSGGQARVVMGGQASPASLVVNFDTLYWVNLGDGSVHVSSVDGTNHRILAVDQTLTTGLASDGVAVYWGDAGSRTIQRGTADGKVRVVATGQFAPTSIAVDGTSVYWASEAGTISRLADGALSVVSQREGSVKALTVRDGQVFFVNEADNTIRTFNLPRAGLLAAELPQSAGQLSLH